MYMLLRGWKVLATSKLINSFKNLAVSYCNIEFPLNSIFSASSEENTNSGFLDCLSFCLTKNSLRFWANLPCKLLLEEKALLLAILYFSIVVGLASIPKLDNQLPSSTADTLSKLFLFFHS